jgi:hypothetical protein
MPEAVAENTEKGLRHATTDNCVVSLTPMYLRTSRSTPAGGKIAQRRENNSLFFFGP